MKPIVERAPVITRAAIARCIYQRAQSYHPALILRSPESRRNAGDFYGCCHGRHFEILVAAPGKPVPTSDLVRLQPWRRAGAITGAVRSADEFFELLQLTTPRFSAKEYILCQQLRLLSTLDGSSF